MQTLNTIKNKNDKQEIAVVVAYIDGLSNNSTVVIFYKLIMT